MRGDGLFRRSRSPHRSNHEGLVLLHHPTGVTVADSHSKTSNNGSACEPTPDEELPWSLPAVVAAVVLCMGTAISSLFFQRVSNAVPKYFYAVAVVSPLLGFICYSVIWLLLFIQPSVHHHHHHHVDCSSPTWSQRWVSLNTKTALEYCMTIGFCFALTNLLVDYGRSGNHESQPDVPAVLTLILLKLVVPVSFGLEGIMENRRPTVNQIAGITIFLAGITFTAVFKPVTEHLDSGDNSKSANYRIKIVSLCVSSFPLAFGFYTVKLARRNLPSISGIELWLLLCIPEFFFSIALAYLSQSTADTSFREKTMHLSQGIMCVLLGIAPQNMESPLSCHEAVLFLWSGLPFAFAFNIAIPVLVALKGSSTVVPLFRAMALPIAALLANKIVGKQDAALASWHAALGVLLCSIGLLIFYCRT